MVIRLTGKIDKIWRNNTTRLWAFKVKTPGKIFTTYSDFVSKPDYEVGDVVCAGDLIKFKETV